MKRVFVLFLAAAALVFGAPAVRAADKPEEAMKATARELFVQAGDFLDKKQYPECYAKAKAAYGVHKHPQITGVIGDCAYGVGKWREAAEMLTAFLAEYESKRPQGQVDVWYLRLKDASSKIAIVEVEVLPGTATIRLGTEVVGTGKAKLFLEPGEMELRAEAAEHKAKVEKRTVKAGEKIELKMTLEKGEPGPGPEVPGGGGVWPKWPLVGVGAGLAAVGIGVGAGLFVAGDGKLNDAKTLGMGLAPGACPAAPVCADILARAKDADTLHNAAVGLFVAGGVLAVATVILIAIPAGSSGKAATSVNLRPSIGGLSVFGNF